MKVSGANAPYRLRAHKGIERNLFVELLKIIDGGNLVDLEQYRYVGFGAASLEDFKSFHYELGIVSMHSIEMDKHAITRQRFNNPFYFLAPYEKESTKYLIEDFEIGKKHVLWLDYTSLKYGEQLKDLELAAAKMQSMDVLKVTFNVSTVNFIDGNNIRSSLNPDEPARDNDFKAILNFLRNDETLQYYVPTKAKNKDIKNFSDLIRAMAVRAIKRGLSNNPNGDLKFNHIAAFNYADGQKMTTLTGMLASTMDFGKLIRQCKLKSWPFFKRANKNELMDAILIVVPDMTVSERILIEKKLPSDDIPATANGLPFKYGKESDHIALIGGYQTFYKYLPYYAKVTY